MDGHLSDDQLESYRKRTPDPNELLATSEHLAACDDCYKRFRVTDRISAIYAFLRSYLEVEPEIDSDHLLYEQMAGFADETLDEADRAVVRRHINECRDCELDLGELLKIRDRLQDQPRRATSQTASADSANLAAVLSARPDQRAAAPIDGESNSARAELAGPTRSSDSARAESTDGLGRMKPAGSAFRRTAGARGTRWMPGVASPYWNQPVYRVAIQAAGLILVVGLVMWAATRNLRQQVRRLEQEAAALRQSNEELRGQAADAEKLQGQVAELERDNERLRGAAGTAASAVSLNDAGSVIALGAGGEVSGLEGVPARYQDLVRAALSSGKVGVGLIPPSTEGQVGTTLGAGEKERFNVLAPVGSAVESDRPVLRWQSLGGATAYVVFIKDAVSGEEIESGELTKTEWSPEKPLQRGHVYNWMVEAVKEGRRVRAPSLDKPYASFKVLDNAQTQELREAKQKWPGSHMLLGVLYARAGARDQAAKEFQALAAANRGSGLARKLLTQVK